MKRSLRSGESPAKENLILQERCANPWNGGCDNADIALYIYFKGSKLPICRSCWKDIAEKDVEWGEGIA